MICGVAACRCPMTAPLTDVRKRHLKTNAFKKGELSHEYKIMDVFDVMFRNSMYGCLSLVGIYEGVDGMLNEGLSHTYRYHIYYYPRSFMILLVSYPVERFVYGGGGRHFSLKSPTYMSRLGLNGH